MRSGKTPPFVRPDRRAFAAQEWHILNGRPLQDGALVPEWDQSLQLVLTRVIEVDIKSVAASGRIGPGAKLALLPSWWSEGTGLRGRGDQSIIVIGEPVNSSRRFELRVVVPGQELAGNLQIRSVLVLLEQTADKSADPLAPHRVGSVLWEDAITVVLEGQQSQYPITVMDFVESNLGSENACWSFEWSPPDPALPAMATMRLYLNARHTLFHAAMVGGNLRPEQLAMRSALKYGLCVEMIRLALEHADELEAGAADFGAASGGRVLIDLIGRIFPGRGPITCREQLAQDPGMFHAEIQARTGLFGTASAEVGAPCPTP